MIAGGRVTNKFYATYLFELARLHKYGAKFSQSLQVVIAEGLANYSHQNETLVDFI